ncbi:alpha/beta fold hydrolase [Marinobacter nanhaiticus D15-8W]|uniref:Alpha/beta hydrolase n=2 Tax=Marinobacter TaxID=2742 RepID=N6WZP9_9GAMM|nr:alpha/beta hydrolase [Marinobacter nanhaiticus D15-8W]BES71620.1 alpha/beta fold hydrolase [Marinobacter nanhaiticus D15-8W]
MASARTDKAHMDKAHADTEWPLRHLVLRGLSWSAPDTPDTAIPIIGLHGWLDNAATFTRIAPALAQLAPMHCIDFPGHGHSEHRPPGQDYVLVDYVADIADLIDRYFEGPVHIVGHSLGGIVGAMYAASFPDRVGRLVMIDSLGPLTLPPEKSAAQLRKGITKRLRGSGAPMTYGAVEDAAKIRAGGLSPLSSEAAHLLVPRNLREVEGGYQWRTDARLRYPSLSRFDEAQVEGFLKAIESPTLFLRAEDGLLGGRESWRGRSRLIPDFREVVVPGSHHCHLDGNVDPVIEAIREFLDPS